MFKNLEESLLSPIHCLLSFLYSCLTRQEAEKGRFRLLCKSSWGEVGKRWRASHTTGLKLTGRVKGGPL